MKILLTGGTGFIGGPVSRALKRRDIDFTLAVYAHNPRLEMLEQDYDVVRVNLLDESSRAELLRTVKPEALIHLAWYVEPNNFWHSPLNMDWVYASLDLFKLFVQHGGTRCLMTGTCAEYDWSKGGCFDEETTPAVPATFYGAAKDALRRVCRGYADITGTSLLWSRLFWPYGPGEPQGRLFSSMIKDWREGKTATCRAGNLKRDYMHVDDIAEALIDAALSREEGVMNIASGKSVALGVLARTLAACAGKENLLHIGKVEPGPENPEEIYAKVERMRSICDAQERTLEENVMSLLQPSGGNMYAQHA